MPAEAAEKQELHQSRTRSRTRGTTPSRTSQRPRTQRGTRRPPSRTSQPKAAQQLSPEQERIAEAIASKDPERILEALRIGTEAPQELSYDDRNFAYRMLLETFKGQAGRKALWKMARYCAARPEIVARQLACAVLDTFWRTQQPEAERILLNLARDEDWEVREYAAATIARIVKKQFRASYRYLEAWAKHPDPAVRREVLIALVAIADEKHPDWAEPLLRLVEANLRDRDPYIRRHLGAFAVGQGLLRRYPQATLAALARWAEAKDETQRWNVAMAFTTPWAGPVWEEALAILRNLASDPRRIVWEAVSLALQNLLGLKPAEVEPRLREWMREPALRVPVSTALAAHQRQESEARSS
jgi:3-methyladenine DNA glycosylase AlkC